MGYIEIYFSGLICHVGPSEKEGSDRTTLVRSILIQDGQHKPKILTSKGTTGPQRTKSLGADLTTGVTFSHLGAAVTTCERLFFETVPHLDDLTRPQVQLNHDPPGLQVHLPAGLFTVVAFYPQGAIWTLDNDITTRACVPKVTMLRAKAHEAMVHFNGANVPLGSTGWVLITNLEGKLSKKADRGKMAKGEHWKKQHTVTTGGPTSIAEWAPLEQTTVKTKNCGPESGKYTAHVLKLLKYTTAGVDTSECTNTHWP
jgi:hypothetical protein